MRKLSIRGYLPSICLSTFLCSSFCVDVYVWIFKCISFGSELEHLICQRSSRPSGEVFKSINGDFILTRKCTSNQDGVVSIFIPHFWSLLFDAFSEINYFWAIIFSHFDCKTPFTENILHLLKYNNYKKYIILLITITINAILNNFSKQVSKGLNQKKKTQKRTISERNSSPLFSKMSQNPICGSHSRNKFDAFFTTTYFFLDFRIFVSIRKHF